MDDVWEVVEEEVLGQRLPVFAHRARSLRELVAASTRFGQAEYVVEGDRRISYNELPALVASAAEALAKRFGVGQGDRVLIWAENRAEYAIAFWAAVTPGAIAVAANGWWTADEVRYAIEHSQPAVLVADRRRLERLGGEDPGVPVIEMEADFAALTAHAPDALLPDVPLAEDDPALILYTSGTTGRPKGALISHRGLIGFVQVNAANVALALARARQAGVSIPEPEPSRILLTAPMFHVSGLMAGIVNAVAGGDTLVLRPGRFDPVDVLRVIEAERITSWAPLGSMGPRVLAAMEEGDFDVSSLRQFGFGGAPMSPTVRQRLLNAFPSLARVGMGYGSSETVAVVTSIGGAEYDAHPTSVGRVLPTIAVEIRDPDEQPVPEGMDGEIHVRSAYLMLGYWRDEAATKATIKPGRWLATGDVGRMVDGLLYIDSRARDMILRSGENVYPIEIEHRLSAHPAVAEVAVIGVDHEILGQEVKAVIVPAAGTDDVDTGELAQWTGDTLAPYKVPSVWEVRSDPLPRNAAGKVLKHLL